MSANLWIILMLIGINVSISAVLLRLRRIDKAIEWMPNIIRSQAEGRERYVELLERKVREQGVA
jgi:hypothetical protein